MKTMQKHPLISGALLLTCTSFVCRVLGFLYRIYLTNIIGAENMGIMQLLTPILALSFALLSAGYQTTLSKYCAQAASQKESSLRYLLCVLSICLPASLLFGGSVYMFSEFLGNVFLHEPRTVPLLRILSFTIPPATIHSCINGYFYGIKENKVPAFSQLLEQICRVGSVYLISLWALKNQVLLTVRVAVLGTFLGELAAVIFSLIFLYISIYKTTLHTKTFSSAGSPLKTYYKNLLSMALPLTANRLSVNLLLSLESVSIPRRLCMYGYDSSTALSVFGVLTGMVLPLILFPNALSCAISVLLLPNISESQANKEFQRIKKIISKTMLFCSGLGICCMLFFIVTGNLLGNILFHNAMAGRLIRLLSFLCPFLYLDTSLVSILHGLGHAKSVLVINLFCLSIRLLFVFFGIPVFGLSAYIIGLIAGSLLQCILYLYIIYQNT